MERRFDARKKPRTQEHSVRAERERGGESASIRDATRGEYGSWRNGVDDHWDERQTRLQPDMAAALGALRNDNVGTGILCTNCFLHASNHERNLRAGIVRARNERLYVLVRTRPCKCNHDRTFGERCGETLFTHIK